MQFTFAVCLGHFVFNCAICCSNKVVEERGDSKRGDRDRPEILCLSISFFGGVRFVRLICITGAPQSECCKYEDGRHRHFRALLMNKVALMLLYRYGQRMRKI